MIMILVSSLDHADTSWIVLYIAFVPPFDNPVDAPHNKAIYSLARALGRFSSLLSGVDRRLFRIPGMERLAKRAKSEMTGADEKQELESLERVSWRLVNTQDAQLGQVLGKLIPVMVNKLNETESLAVKQLVLKILAHSNARLGSGPASAAGTLSMSPAGIYQAYSAASNPVAKNIGLVYTQKAFERCPEAERPAIINMVVTDIHKKPREHRSALLLHAFVSLRGLSPAAVSAVCESNPNVLEDLETEGRRRDAHMFLEQATKLLMYVPGRDGPGAAMMAGLSTADVEAMAKIPLLQYETVEQVQLGVLEYVYAATMDPNSVHLLYLAAASSPFTAVGKRGEAMLAKTCVLDTARPTVDVENRDALKNLYDAYLGNLEDETVPEGLRRQPASRALQSRIIVVLCKSTLACNMNPESSMLIHDAIFGSAAGVSSQQQGMQFAVHVLRHADSLKYLAPSVIQHSLRILENSQGNANMNALRGFAYQSLGQLAQRDPATLEEHKIELSKQCFEALKIEPPGVRSAVQETVNCLSNCFSGRREDEEDEEGSATDGGALAVRDLLTQYIKSDSAAVRQAALHWWIWVYPFSDCGARFHCILLSSDSNVNISDLAREGLDAEKVLSFQRSKGRVALECVYPRIGDMLAAIAAERPSLVGDRRSTRPMTELAMPAASMEAMIGFLRNLSAREPQGALDDDGLSLYFSVLTAAITPQAPRLLRVEALDSMLLLASKFDKAFLKHFVAQPHRFEAMLHHPDEAVACMAARLLGFLGRAMDAGALESLIGRLHDVLSGCIVKINNDKKTVKQEECLGSMYAAGFVVAWGARRVGGALATPDGNTKESFDPNLLTQLVEDLEALSTASRSADYDVIRSVAVLALGYSTLCPAIHGDQERSPLSLIDEDGPIKQLKSSPHKEVHIRVSRALGLLGMTEADEARKDVIVDLILDQCTSKSEKLLEACGMALVFIWGGADYDDRRHLLTDGAGGATDPATSSSIPEDAYLTTTNAKHASSLLRSKVLKFVVNKCISSTRAEARLAGATWLLNLIEHVASTPEISNNISDIQQAFCMLLGDSNERTQELASRGVTTAYQHARDDSKSQLVDSLVGILSGSGGGGSNPKKWMRPNHVEGDTQIFEPGTLGSLPDQGGSISTYKEICSLATDLGQPDLIYQFMNLAAHQAAADASRGAAYGMASVAAIAGDELKEHVQALIPRLYRSTFDPNPLVRDSMRHIWVVLVDDQRVTLKTHLAAILSLLSKDMTRQQWRVRESAALAMADILQGLTWADVQDAFEAILKSCFRVIDDVKESVAVAGQALARAISSLAVRLTDSQSTKSVDSNEFLRVIFPLLTDTGISSDVPIIRAFSVDMIAKLTKAAGKEAVQDSMHIIVPPLLESLSGMEDARLNYLEQHVQRLGVDVDRFEEERIRFAQSSPIAETLDLCSKHISGPTFCSISGMLISFIRKAVGSATKSGAATFITASVRRLGSEVKPVAFAIMKALHEASSLERSASVRKAYASAYANLSKFAPRSKLDMTIDLWLSECKQENTDQDTVLLTGTMLKAIASEASDVFLRYANDLAPLAFLLQYEELSADAGGASSSDSNVKKLKPKPTPAAMMWAAVWEEVTTATGSGVRGHVATIADILIEALSSSHWGRKKAAGRGFVVLGETAGDILGEQVDKIVDGLLRALSGRLWEGKEVLLESLASLVVNSRRDMRKEKIEKAVEALLAACQKKTVAFNTVAFVQLGRVGKALGDVAGKDACPDFYPKVWPVFESIMATGTKNLEDVEDAKPDAKPENTTVRTTPLAVTIDCMASFWAGSVVATRDVTMASSTIDVLTSVLRTRCEKIDDQKAALQALWEVVNSRNGDVGDQSTVPLADALAMVTVSGKAEHNRLLAGDVLLKLLEHQPASEVGKLLAMLGETATTLRAHQDKSAAVRSRIDDILRLL